MAGRGRPRLDIGTYGEINVWEARPGVFEARARFRQRNGRTVVVGRRARANGTSEQARKAAENAAKRALKKALTDMVDEVAGKEITAETRLTRVMDMWIADFTEKVELGRRASKSLYEYTDIINNYLRPEVGELACREAANAGLVNEVLKKVRRKAAESKRSKTGEAAMLRAKTVLSGVCGLAVLHGAMKTNPVKSVEKIDREQEPVRALEPEERADFLKKFRLEVERRGAATQLGPRAQAWLDLPELVAGMLSTGMRIGEALATVPESVDLDGREVHASHHLVREKGKGIIRKAKRKGDRPGLKVPIVSWTESMWRRRMLAAPPGGPLFAAWNGQWLDPGNVAKRIREVCDAIDYGWVSSRYFRHTTGSHLTDSGLTVHEGADALGNTPEVFEKHYRRKRVSNPKIAAALETMLESGNG